MLNQDFIRYVLAQQPTRAEIDGVIAALEKRANEIEVNCDVLHYWTGCSAQYIAGELSRAAAMRITAETLRNMVSPVTVTDAQIYIPNAPIMGVVA